MKTVQKSVCENFSLPQLPRANTLPTKGNQYYLFYTYTSRDMLYTGCLNEPQLVSVWLRLQNNKVIFRVRYKSTNTGFAARDCRETIFYP